MHRALFSLIYVSLYDTNLLNPSMKIVKRIYASLENNARII